MAEQAVVQYTCTFCGAVHSNKSDVKSGYCIACKEKFFSTIDSITGNKRSGKPVKFGFGDIIGLLWGAFVFILIAGFIAVQFIYR